MRARNLKPGFFKNELLAELPYEARLLFEGLWCVADRAGRMEDRPKRIKAELFPYDNLDIEPLLQALAANGFIARYIVAGKRYLAVVNFSKHQNPHVKERESTLPAPDEHDASTIQTQVLHPLTPDSLTPDSLTPDSIDNPLSTDPVDGEGLELKPGEAQQVFEHWKTAMGRNGATHFDDKRKKAVRWALKTYGLETCLAAVDGYAASDFHMGRDPVSGGKKFNDLTLIFRDADHAEKFLSTPRSLCAEIDEIWGTDED